MEDRSAEPMTSPTAASPRATQEPSSPELAVVVPVLNEEDNVAPLVAEIDAALGGLVAFEIVFVDDGSSDATPDRLRDAAGRFPNLRVVRHDRCAGQSAAIVSGVRAARAPIIATLDGDGQNDPSDIPSLLGLYRRDPDPDRVLIAGHRTRRRDRWIKRASSRIANRVRARLLDDATPDTGCGLKIFSRRAFLDMPAFDHMHRFLPALMIRRGGRVISIPVHHRPRAGGRSKYGTLDRLGVGIVDLLGMIWLRRRARLCTVGRKEGDADAQE
jgi:dolichol-phosphate mannosyltransferase